MTTNSDQPSGGTSSVESNSSGFIQEVGPSGMPVEESEYVRDQTARHQLDGSIQVHFERDAEPLMDLDDKYCAIWPGKSNEGFTHHASFGDDGVTATVSRFGDVMQVTRFLGHGTSGLFSIDQTPTEKPYYVVERAQNLDEISKDPFSGGWSYGLMMSSWPTEPPTIIKWVNFRWPRFEWKLKGRKIVFQYYVHKGIVLQQLLFQNLSDEQWDLDLVMKRDLAIRDLDFMSPPALNEEAAQDSKSVEYGLVRTKSFPDSPRQQSRSLVVASIDVFIDGKRQKFKYSPSVPRTALKKGECTEIVVAHSLNVVRIESGKESWQIPMINAAEANISSFLSAFRKVNGEEASVVSSSRDSFSISRTTQTRAQTDHLVTNDERRYTNPSTTTAEVHHQINPVSLSESKKIAEQLRKIQYLTRRHLEHILSVCAVPINDPNTKPETTSGVALTCGDMSGHRICTSASFFAFQFLIDFERQQRQSPQGEGNNYPGLESSVRQRIKTTCEGHMVWLSRVWENSKVQPFNPGCFTANYWVNGEKIDSPESQTWQPVDSITDTAFQILKMTEFVKTFPESVLIETVNSLLTKIFVAWLQDLDRLDYRDKFVWPRPKRDGVDIYRLEDHFWVWKALKGMEDQRIWSELPLPERSRNSSGYWYKDTEAGLREKERQENFQRLTTWSNETVSNFDQLYDEFYMITRRIVPTEVQRSIVQRFTTVNDISGVRMLAVSRSSRDTRFLLHDRDSAMFYGRNGGEGFFPDRSSQSLWDQTIKAQPYHPANDKSGSQWFTVMRYALSIMMGAKKSSLNTKKASDALRDSCNTLLYFFNHNGFLGEPLSDLAREPVLFDEECDRDSYFHASFEVIYVLFTHAKYLEVPVDAKEVPKTPGQLMTDPKSEMLIHIEETGHRHYRLPTRRMEERIPFSNHMVSSRVCPIEEEWVYNYPEFLSDPGFYLESPINEALRVRIADAKKQKQYGKPRRRKPHWIDHPEFHEFHGTDLLDKLAEARRAQNAKKRCIWLSNPDPESARRFLIASVSDVEKQPLTLFLDHHFQRTKDVHDDTSLALNVWNSEVHLSFHCLCENMPAKDVEGARISDASLPCIRLPGSPTQVLRRAFMSYRFHGDIFDRYWTCHILDTQIMPQTNESDEMRLGLELLLPKEIHRSVFKFADLHKALWQRKVLELVLLMRMLLAISGNTNLIIGHLKGLLSLSRGPQPNTRPGQQGSPRSPSDASALQDQCVDTLNDVESDLTSSLEIIQKWGDRTQSHGDEKPRWTLKDEDKYRRSIRGVQASLDKLTSEIRKQREEVKVLQKRFKSESKQCRTIFVDGQKSKKEAKEKERATRDANSERNIRWFTYVTIVFAPLGFAQGFYSMGGTPSPELVKSLATFSVAALAVTVILLLIGITTFSVLERRRSIMLKIYEARMPQQGLWSLLASTILELITRLIKYPMSVRDDQGGSSMTAIPGVALALAVGILLSPLFVMTWLMQFVAYALGDLYEILKRDLYQHSNDPSTKQDVSDGIRHDAIERHWASRPPRPFQKYLKESNKDSENTKQASRLATSDQPHSMQRDLEK